MGAGSLQSSAALSTAHRRRDRAARLSERLRTGWGPRLIAGRTGVAHSTVCGAASPRPVARREGSQGGVCRYEWPCPGDLLHMDVKRYPRFSAPVTP